MKKIIMIVATIYMLTIFACAETNDNSLVCDFTAKYSYEKEDLLGFTVKDGFHVSVLDGCLSTVSTLGIPITYVLENNSLGNYDYAVFVMKCGYIDDNSVLTMKYTDDKGNVTAADYQIPHTDFNLYCVKLPDTNTVKFEIFVNSPHPDMDMYSVDLDYVRFYKTEKPVLLTIDSTKAFAGEEIKTLESPAVIRNDFTLTPARFVAESLGADVAWDGNLRKVTITKSDVVIELVIDNPVATVNGKEIILDVAPCIINDFTYTPARFVAENLGALVEWEAAYKTVIIS